MDYKQPIEEKMNAQTMTLGIPNGLLIIRDPTEREYPEVDGIANYWRSDSCIIVSCDEESDGDTTIMVNHERAEAGSLIHLVELSLHAPSGRLIIEIVPGDQILELPLERTQAHVQIWTDGHHGTQKIFLEIT